jgi:hypothetical protein
MKFNSSVRATNDRSGFFRGRLPDGRAFAAVIFCSSSSISICSKGEELSKIDVGPLKSSIDAWAGPWAASFPAIFFNAREALSITFDKTELWGHVGFGDQRDTEIEIRLDSGSSISAASSMVRCGARICSSPPDQRQRPGVPGTRARSSAAILSSSMLEGSMVDKRWVRLVLLRCGFVATLGNETLYGRSRLHKRCSG